MVVRRERKSPFVKLFDKTPEGINCPHFYELILSNGCPYECSYCYLNLTFRGNKQPTLFTNNWESVEKELEKVPCGVFSTGELADSLAVIPPLLEDAIKYFSEQTDKYLLLLTKSANISIFDKYKPSKQIIVSFSINSLPAWEKYENGTASPSERFKAAQKLKDNGWRVRLRIDPIILDIGLESYKSICERAANLNPEMVTIGTLRQYPGLYRFSTEAPREGLKKAGDGRMRYPLEDRIRVYDQIKEWLGFQPTICKESNDLWSKLNWEFYGCNCTS